jgi:hypothetical protein
MQVLLDSRLRGNDERGSVGMTVEVRGTAVGTDRCCKPAPVELDETYYPYYKGIALKALRVYLLFAYV